MGCIRHENELRESDKKKESYRRKEELLWNQWEVIRVGLKIKGNRNKLNQSFKECEKMKRRSFGSKASKNVKKRTEMMFS